MLITGRSLRRSMMAAGSQVAGTCQMTFLPGIIPSPGDQVWPDDEEHVVNEVLRRQLAQIDPAVVRERATHPAHLAPIVPPVTERLLYPDVTCIESVHWLVDERGPKEHLGIAREGRDYTRRDNILTWREGSGPAPGKAFTVRYRAPAVYEVGPDAEPAARTNEPGFPYRVDAYRLDSRGQGSREGPT